MTGLHLRYREALARYVGARDEAALSQAYEIGRQALEQGLGVLDVTEMHQQEMARIGMASSSGADAFFRELLSPYEMAFRGYHQANLALREANQELLAQKAGMEASNRDLESFSYTVSHDLRAPLSVITGFSLALREDHGAGIGDGGLKYIDQIVAASTRMTVMIDGLLSLARLTGGDLHAVRVDLAEMARAVAGRLQAAEPERQVEFVIPAELEAVGEPRLLGVLLDNLLGNAWKFSAKRGQARIELGAQPEAGAPAYFVRDNGAGFDMGYAGKLFGAFQRLHKSGEFEGYGIGLATARRVVQWHGGRIWAEGRPGAGATFFFTLGPSPHPTET